MKILRVVMVGALLTSVMLNPLKLAFADTGRTHITTTNGTGSSSHLSEMTTPRGSGGKMRILAGESSVKQRNPAFVPGDFFYFVKTIIENVRLALTFNDTQKAKLLSNYADQRTAEANKLMDERRTDLAVVTLQTAISTVNEAITTVTKKNFSSKPAKSDSTKQSETITQDSKLNAAFTQNIKSIVTVIEKVKNPKAQAILVKNMQQHFGQFLNKLDQNGNSVMGTQTHESTDSKSLSKSKEQSSLSANTRKVKKVKTDKKESQKNLKVAKNHSSQSQNTANLTSADQTENSSAASKEGTSSPVSTGYVSVPAVSTKENTSQSASSTSHSSTASSSTSKTKKSDSSATPSNQGNQGANEGSNQSGKGKKSTSSTDNGKSDSNSQSKPTQGATSPSTPDGSEPPNTDNTSGDTSSANSDSSSSPPGSTQKDSSSDNQDSSDTQNSDIIQSKSSFMSSNSITITVK